MPRNKHLYTDVSCCSCGKVWRKRNDEVKRKRSVGEPLRCANCSARRTYVSPSTYPELSSETWAYLAGFFDGEGCLTFPESGSPQLTITQVETGVLYWIKDTTSIGKVSNKGGSASAWRLTNVHDILWFLRGVEPYLKVKFIALQRMTDYLERRVDHASLGL